jgi:TRAP-type C4-dicarboxylate transport system permease small subunit
VKPGKIVSITEGAIHRLTQGGYWIAGVVLFSLMLLVPADVIGRYVFSKPIPGANEIEESIMVLLVFFGLAYCTLKKGHVSVELLVSRLSEQTQAILDSLTSFASAGIFALIAWRTSILGWHEVVTSTEAGLVLGIPYGPFMLLAAVGSALLCFEMLIHFSHHLAQLTGRRLDK